MVQSPFKPPKRRKPPPTKIPTLAPPPAPPDRYGLIALALKDLSVSVSKMADEIAAVIAEMEELKAQVRINTERTLPKLLSHNRVFHWPNIKC